MDTQLMSHHKSVTRRPATDTLAILKRVASAFPEKNITNSTLRVYQEELADIPIELLDKAASQIIRTSSWFPRVAELRTTAQQLSGAVNFSNLPDPGFDSLNLEASKLENDYFKHQKFDANAWDHLAAQLDRQGRYYQADELRRKSQHIHENQLAHQKGEEYPPQTQRSRYAHWDSAAGD